MGLVLRDRFRQQVEDLIGLYAAAYQAQGSHDDAIANSKDGLGHSRTRGRDGNDEGSQAEPEEQEGHVQGHGG